MNNGMSWLFFVLFAFILVLMYLAVRRRWGSPGMASGVGVLASILSMVFMALSQGNSIFQAVVVGILLGGLFSGATLAVAWYFHSSDPKARAAAASQASGARPQAVITQDEDY
jgi:hypothetical protein